jgi:signal transduction histidine kinase
VTDTYSRRAVKWLVVVLGLTLIPAMYTMLTAGNELARHLTPGQIFVTACLNWYALGMVIPVILWLIRRLPLRRRTWPLAVAAILGAGVVTMVAKETVFLGLDQLAGTVFGPAYSATARWYAYEIVPMPPFVEQLRLNVTGKAYGWVLEYLLVLGMGYAHQHYQMSRERERQAVRLEASLSQARLQALKMQLQPHFLFNTLNSISELMHQDIDAAERMITRLSDMLRLVLEGGADPLVPLQKEMELLSAYLEIQKIRLQERLLLDLEVDPAARTVLVPHMILQPLAENAIRHGIARRVAPGRLVIRVYRGDGSLQVEILNDGPDQTASPASSGGIGLGNTRNRLEQLYSGRFRFESVPAPGNRWLTRMTLPLPPEITAAAG